ncbi:receptor expression-enhancing protein 5-like [Amblyomma americanum]
MSPPDGNRVDADSSEEASTSEGKPSNIAMSSPPKKPLICRILHRFHCLLRAQMYADTILGRSAAELQEASNIKREFLLYILVILLILSLLIGVFGRHVSNLICVPYPAVVSMISVDSNIRQRYVKWITYWMVFGFVNVVDMMCPLISTIVPQYYLWRTLFLAWCFSPYKWNGCKLIRESLYTSRNMRILRVIAYVFYEAARMLTVQ